jgi:hypothetical protein
MLGGSQLGVAAMEKRSPTVLAVDLDNVGDLLRVEKSGDTGHQVLAESRVAGEDVCVSALLDVFDEERSPVLCESLQQPSA